jgi:hypothetical protein
MQYPDLSEYSYASRALLPNVRSVGWLAASFEFTRGSVDCEVLQKLRHLALHNSVNQMRGFHDCDFCDQREIWVEVAGGRRLLGSAEIWVPDGRDQLYYGAPDLIVHYIGAHLYQPPQEYLDAVKRLDIAAYVPPDSAWRLAKSV